MKEDLKWIFKRQINVPTPKTLEPSKTRFSITVITNINHVRIFWNKFSELILKYSRTQSIVILMEWTWIYFRDYTNNHHLRNETLLIYWKIKFCLSLQVLRPFTWQKVYWLAREYVPLCSSPVISLSKRVESRYCPVLSPNLPIVLLSRRVN